jgi:hypothetical protein
MKKMPTDTLSLTLTTHISTRSRTHTFAHLREGAGEQCCEKCGELVIKHAAHNVCALNSAQPPSVSVSVVLVYE